MATQDKNFLSLFTCKNITIYGLKKHILIIKYLLYLFVFIGRYKTCKLYMNMKKPFITPSHLWLNILNIFLHKIFLKLYKIF